MGEKLSKISAHREAILLGEIGALLHMFGKCSSGFLIANSQEGGTQDKHTSLDWMSAEFKSCLESQKLVDRFVFSINRQQEKLADNFTDFIRKYKGNSPDSILLHLFNTCHRMISADEKGVVRLKQSKDDMWITTPFGYPTKKIDPMSLDQVRSEMESNLSKALNEYVDGKLKIDQLHDRATAVLKGGMSQALGETRKPANDVSLWAQSHGVASLYKPVLAALVLGLDPCPRNSNNDLEYNSIRWRLLGIGWNGLGFVQRGRKPSDILKRQEVLRGIQNAIQRLLEHRFPIGNLFYRDMNGLFFTFPGFHDHDDDARELIGGLASEFSRITREQSDLELWPFLTLSKPRRSLTAITREIQVRDQLASMRRVAMVLSMEDAEGSRHEILMKEGPSLTPPSAGQDICPVCQFRAKQNDELACTICRERRKGRLDEWRQHSEEQTIWVDEVADRNNRLALLTLRFDLTRWLNGEWLTTAFSQTYQGWIGSDRMKKLLNNNQQKRKLEQIRNPISADAESATAILQSVGTGNASQDAGFKAVSLSSFFEDVIASQKQDDPNYIVSFLENLRGRIDDSTDYTITGNDLAAAIFTQNPSPSRLARIWKATQEYLEGLVEVAVSTVFQERPQRLYFVVNERLQWPKHRETYRVTIAGLNPASLTVLCTDNDERSSFQTVASPEKFSFKDGDEMIRGLKAIRRGLERNGISSAYDEETGQPIRDTRISCGQIEGLHAETYLPFIELGRSPVFCQVLLPAEKIPAVLYQMLNLERRHFGKVPGKLPLHGSVLVANRRYPLYSLLEAGQMALNHDSCSRGTTQSPWWQNAERHGQDPFYGHYPKNPPNDKGWALSDLTPIEESRQFWMTPGYFDFDFLSSTADRHNIRYDSNNDNQPVRPSICYGFLQPRPTKLHRLQDLLKVWGILVENLTSTQRYHMEHVLIAKLERWKAVSREEVKPVFESFGMVLLQTTFGKDKWCRLDQKQRTALIGSLKDGLLLEALELFHHIVKVKDNQETPDE